MDPANNYDIEFITQILDEELIRRRKKYLRISEANGILLDKGIFSLDDYKSKALIKLLENDKLKHAYYANTLPPEWRIPLSTIETEISTSDSNIGKNSNLTARNDKKNYVNCPYCYKSSIYVRVDDRGKPTLKCPKCNKSFDNPLKNAMSDQYQKIRNKAVWILGSIILIILFVVFDRPSKDFDSDTERLVKYENAIHIGWDYSTWLETTDETIWGNDLVVLPGTNNNIYIGYWVKPNITMYLDKRTDEIIRFAEGKGN